MCPITGSAATGQVRRISYLACIHQVAPTLPKSKAAHAALGEARYRGSFPVDTHKSVFNRKGDHLLMHLVSPEKDRLVVNLLYDADEQSGAVV